MGNEQSTEYTWDDWSNEFDPDLAALNRVRELANHGCVCRALASVLGVPLTPQQEDYRLEQRKTEPDIIEIAYDLRALGLPVDAIHIHQAAVAGEHQNVLDYMNSIQVQTDTPAGQVLSGLDFDFQRLTPTEIREQCEQGNKVVWAEPGHAAHIEPNGLQASFLLLSDGRIEYTLPDRLIDVLVFTKK